MKINKNILREAKRIWREARNGNSSILNNNLVDSVIGDWGMTPLHILASSHGSIDVLYHPSVDRVEDYFKRTPLHWLVCNGKIKLKHLKARYPWYKFKKYQRVSLDLITKIIKKRGIL